MNGLMKEIKNGEQKLPHKKLMRRMRDAVLKSSVSNGGFNKRG
jgi:hypothetical protein